MTFGKIDIPHIESSRLRLREPQANDLEPSAEFYTDATATKFIGGTKTRSEVWRSIAGILGHWHLRGFGLWAVEQKSSGSLVGFSGCWAPEGWQDNEIGYSIFPEFQRQGLASEAVRASLNFAYRTLGWQTAVSYVDPQNIASRAVAKGCGAALDGTTTLMEHEGIEVWRHLPPQKFLERYAG
jgi:RimJ/RimL family protein N-acetyltransferase